MKSKRVKTEAEAKKALREDRNRHVIVEHNDDWWEVVAAGGRRRWTIPGPNKRHVNRVARVT